MAWESPSLALPAGLIAFRFCPARRAQGCSAVGAGWALRAGGHPAPGLAVLQAGKPAQGSSPGFLFPGRSLVYSWSNPKDILHKSARPLTGQFPLDSDDHRRALLVPQSVPPAVTVSSTLKRSAPARPLYLQPHRSKSKHTRKLDRSLLARTISCRDGALARC